MCYNGKQRDIPSFLTKNDAPSASFAKGSRQGKTHMNKPNECRGRAWIAVQAVTLAVILAVSLFFLWSGQHNTQQASSPIVAGVSFTGEYRIGNGEWQPIREGEHISSTQGNVTLRGYFQMLDPFTNEVLGPLSEGTRVFLYFNHLGGIAHTPLGFSVPFETENEILGEDACAIFWGSYTVTAPNPDTGDHTLTILLRNPHSFGNENAVDEFLHRMSLADLTMVEDAALQEGNAERAIGLVIVVAAILILGIAAFSSILHIARSREIWILGLMSLFAGGYFLFDAFGISFWCESNILSTRALGLCMMLFMLVSAALISVLLPHKRLRTVAWSATAFSAISILLCILCSFPVGISFYDTWSPWAIGQAAVVAILILCLLLSIPKAPLLKRILYAVGALALCAFPIDLLATALGWWEGGIVSKHAFLLVFLMALVVILRIIPSHVNAAARARQLEAEQKALQLELQESRISIMLSQMQPHFIFNTLNTIYHLCSMDPAAAKSTISAFSEYLRNNIDNLEQRDMIPFEKELSFVRTYLDIEKIRFDDELEITMDIRATGFNLPVLTVQPIVENAVKHGTSKKEGVAELHISSRETADAFVITIADTGVGFDPESCTADGHRHVGIANVRQRLQNLCGGTLTVESERGVGTTATITIPKEDTV